MAVLALQMTLVCTVELRGGSVVDAPIADVTLVGVRIAGDQPRHIAWDHVKVIRGEWADDAERYMALAEKAWRARLRLSRGDAELAEPLFEELFERYRGIRGPTSLMVAEGTLMCRLRRGEQGAAFGAWLQALELRRAGTKLDGEGDPDSQPQLIRTLLVENYGLTPALPPLFLAQDAAALLAREPTQGGEDPIVDALRALYRRAAAIEAGQDVGAAPPLGSEASAHPGVTLVRQMVLAQDPDAGVRSKARDALRDSLDDGIGSWIEGWKRAALGRSLLREAAEGERLKGVLNLLHLPARFPRSQAYLAGVCEALAAEELRAMGREGEAGAVIDSLRARDPRHPALAPPVPSGGEDDVQGATQSTGGRRDEPEAARNR